MEYVAETISRLVEEQKQKQLKRIYVITTYVIGKERLLTAVHKKTGCKIGVTQQKMDTLKCLDLPGGLCSLGTAQKQIGFTTIFVGVHLSGFVMCALTTVSGSVMSSLEPWQLHCS